MEINRNMHGNVISNSVSHASSLSSFVIILHMAIQDLLFYMPEMHRPFEQNDYVMAAGIPSVKH